ncbi:MAG: 3-oxoacyl-ACP reductase FabG [Myxococcales bacterium]|nr:3-oxoacyl-ACP reductase FabG [Myxococcota bacterium]MDW8280626.1 3-oxoacyl-ACP reductase FabG [Myxococcales bacterium]
MHRALVTGGTRGLGLAIAQRLARGGREVVVTYAQNEAAAQQVQEQAQAEGLAIRAVRCDAARADDWKALFARNTPLGEEGVEVMVHAAGFTRDRLLLMMSEEDLDAVLGVHLRGGFLAARAVLRGMIAARSGRIIFITSPTAALGRPGQTSYGAAKAGLAGLMRSLVHEVSRFQITVNCVCAGLVDTALTAQLSAEVRRQLLSAVPLARLGRPEEIAAAVDWLASPRAGYITGQILAVDGGLTYS